MRLVNSIGLVMSLSATVCCTLPFKDSGEKPSSLTYQETNIVIDEGKDFTTDEPSIDGTPPFTYTLTNTDASIDFVSIDIENGTIFIDGTKSIAGNYVLKVLVENSFGKVEFDPINLTIGEVPVIVGKYKVGNVILIDGNFLDDATTDLLIIDGMLLFNQIGDLNLNFGESNFTTSLIDIFFRDRAPCTNSDVSTWNYEIEFNDDNTSEFICKSEGNVSEETGTWQFVENYTILQWTILTSISPVPISMTILNLVITDNSIAGTVEAFPMVIDANFPLSVENLQFISINITLDKVQ